MTMHTDYTFHDSPLGRLLLVAEDDALVGLYLAGQRGEPTPQDAWRQRGEAFDRARRQLDAYFAGRRRSFELELRPHGTAFQRAVWGALVRIPFGATRSYGELAAALGHPGAARAVGAANGSNPISIVVPCHRVVGKDGALRGYAGGELRKRWLLDHERDATVPVAIDASAGAP